MWQLEGEHFRVATTVDRDSAAWIPWWADQTWPDLVRLFGRAPEVKPLLVCVRDIPQYNVFAGGDPAAGRAPNEAHGWSSIHYAFFADAYLDQALEPLLWRGAGACYWDTGDPALSPYGQHAVRHAAAHSFVEEFDPSWDYVSQVVTSGQTFQSPPFWREKRIPLWLRYGAASYVERFFRDLSVDQESGDPWWARKWALQNLSQAGGMRPLEEVFRYTPDPNQPEDGGRWIGETGLLVSFLLDGGCQALEEVHAAFKAAIAAGDGEGIATTTAELERALLSQESALRSWAEAH